MLTTKMYLHSSKEQSYDKGVELGLKGEALEYFMYTCYEVELDVVVDKKNGEAFITAVNNVKLPTKVKA